MTQSCHEYEQELIWADEDRQMNKTRQRYYWFCLAANELRQDMIAEEWDALVEWSEKFARTRRGYGERNPKLYPGSPDDVWPESIAESWEALK